MPTLVIEGREFEVDGNGFLQTPEIWNDEVARLFEDGTSDLVVNNDTRGMGENKHLFDVVSPDGARVTVDGAQALAGALAERLSAVEGVAA